MSDWYAHCTVGTVVVRNKQYLMVEEIADGERVINQPAGHVEQGETLAEAALRETREETGWQVQLTGVLGLALYTSPTNGITYHRTTFLAEPQGHDADRPLDTGIVRASWFSREELAANSARMRSPLVLDAIDQYLAGNIYPLDIIYGP